MSFVDWLKKNVTEARDTINTELIKFKSKDQLEAILAGSALVAYAEGDVSAAEKQKLIGSLRTSDQLKVFDVNQVIKSFPALLLMMGLAATASAASFDCTRATSFAEQRVCLDFSLSGLDERLARRFKDAMEAAADPASQRREQIKWIRQNRDVCTDDACLERAYRTRLAELEAQLTYVEPKAEPARKPETAAPIEQPVTEAPMLPEPAESITPQPVPVPSSAAAATLAPDYAATPAPAATSERSQTQPMTPRPSGSSPRASWC